MKILVVTTFLEAFADPILQENYDNAGLIVGDENAECVGILCCLDATEEVIQEAVERRCNLVVAHHPIIFTGLKRITNKDYTGRAAIIAVKNDIAIYAIHTNLDNVISGVNGRIASILNLQAIKVLSPKPGILKKLYTFCPLANVEDVRQAIFVGGGGKIGNYSECSFNVVGEGTFTPGENTTPFVGTEGERHREKEVRIEVVFYSWLENQIVKAMKEAHPYEEVAYDIISLANSHKDVGSGLIGELNTPMYEEDFLAHLQKTFDLQVIRHTPLRHAEVRKVAVCGGAGSFLVKTALRADADIFITADMKYHEFFDANDRMLIADIGHYESERFTIDLLREILAEKFLNFAVLKTSINTNPVRYFVGVKPD